MTAGGLHAGRFRKKVWGGRAFCCSLAILFEDILDEIGKAAEEEAGRSLAEVRKLRGRDCRG